MLVVWLVIPERADWVEEVDNPLTPCSILAEKRERKHDDLDVLALLLVSLRGLGGDVGATLLGGLGLGVVGEAVEVNEEQEVGREETAAEKSSTLGTGALANVGEVRPVGEGKVGVGAEVDESEVEDELSNLEGGQVLLPPDADTGSRAHVVVVHEDVDGQVEGDGDPRDGGVTAELDEAKDHGHGVMEVVQELY